MADTTSPQARDTASLFDSVQLHAQAMNSLSRCMRELRQEHTDYERAKHALAVATQALQALAVADVQAMH